MFLMALRVPGFNIPANVLSLFSYCKTVFLLLFAIFLASFILVLLIKLLVSPGTSIFSSAARKIDLIK